MSLRLFWVLPLSALLLGCPPEIGNKCTLSTDCSQVGDRQCDGTQPDGYCTVFNCVPDACPDSICVAFDPTLDPACQGTDQGRSPRFERTFCLKPCSSDGNCRDQYVCVDLTPVLANGEPNPNLALRRAQVVDTGAADGGLGYGVCMALALAADGGVIPEDAGVRTDVGNGDGGIPAVCNPVNSFPTDGGVPWTPFDGGSN